MTHVNKSIFEILKADGVSAKVFADAKDTYPGSWDPGLDCSGYVDDDGEWHDTPSLTRQADADDCDINVMMARYQNTGELPRMNPRAPQWGDFSSVLDYREALDVVRQAETDFDMLPADVRDRFGNDPAKMLEFLSDPENKAEAIKLGLVVAPPEPSEPMRVEVVNSPSDTPPKPSKGKAEAGG